MNTLFYVLGGVGVIAFLVILILTSLPSPTVTHLLKRYFGPKQRQ